VKHVEYFNVRHGVAINQDVIWVSYEFMRARNPTATVLSRQQRQRIGIVHQAVNQAPSREWIAIRDELGYDEEVLECGVKPNDIAHA
jgi:hypothetical protein